MVRSPSGYKGRDNGDIQSDSTGPLEQTEMDTHWDRGTNWSEHLPEAPRDRLDRDGLLKHHEGLCDSARELMDKKNRDYATADGDGDPFANFRMCEQMDICTTDEGMVIRLSDKLSRLARLLSPGYDAKVKDESITDTLIDVINYAVLISAYREDNAKIQSGREISSGESVDRSLLHGRGHGEDYTLKG